MTEQSTQQAHWQAANNRYMEMALEWVRLKLQALVPVPPAPPAPLKPCRRWWQSQTVDQPPASPIVSPAVIDVEPKPSLEQLEQDMLALEQAALPPMLVLLARRFQLSHFEQSVLLLCVAQELDTRIATLCAEAQASPHKPYPTFALAFNLFAGQGVWDALLPESPLRYWRLLEFSQNAHTPLVSRALQADARVVHYLQGLNRVDERLIPLFSPLAAPGRLAISQQVVAQQVADYLGQAENDLTVIQLVGADSNIKQQVVQVAMQQAHSAWRRYWQVWRLVDTQLPMAGDEFATFVRLWQRETHLLPVALYIEVTDNDSKERMATLTQLLGQLQGLVFVDTRDIRPERVMGTLTVDISKPTVPEQRSAWLEGLADLAMVEGLEARLAAQFNFHLPAIDRISAQVTASDPAPAQLEQTVRQACLSQTRLGLDKLAQRIDAKARWGELVLPDAPLQLLRNLAAQVGQRYHVYDEWGFRAAMNRGLGISALFAGESGTGKTMAAEVLANALGLDLYRIDLSAVVSKYIGETEKNLRQVFDAAEEGGAILFFDEADALFGKRSEVKDSHDRYANIEVNYLLQRMESFSGLAILATNLKSALDSAFVRRLRFVVDFPLPGEAERRLIWAMAFPDSLPVDESLDCQRLVKFNLTGGSIHNIVLNAAFLAAQETPTVGRKVALRHVLAATRMELRKLERPINERDFALPNPAPALTVVGQRG